MPTHSNTRILPARRALPPLLETLFSALGAAAMVGLLGFFLSLESWVLSLVG